MDRSSKKVLGGVLVSLFMIIGACIGGMIYASNDKIDKEERGRLNSAFQSTADREGYCLTDFIEEYQLSLSTIPDLYKDACVSIVVQTELETEKETWLGSGVCVASCGYEYGDEVLDHGSYIVTNYHVIETVYLYEETKVYVYVNEYSDLLRYSDFIPLEAEVLWSDSYLDMAIIYVKEDIDWVRMKDRSIACEDQDLLENSEQVFVIGSPQSLDYQNTVTKGNISGYACNYSYTTEEIFFTERMSNIYEYLIPMRVSIMGGNSGGGLFDSEGYLVGQPTLGTTNSQSSSAINYSIPIYSALLILDDLIDLNEDEADPEIKIYSLNDLGFVTIDQFESDVMQTGFSGTRKYFYGKPYMSSKLEFTGSGLKVIASEIIEIPEDAIIKTLTFMEETKEINCRNDLIFMLLRCKAGDEIKFGFVFEEEESEFILILA